MKFGIFVFLISTISLANQAPYYLAEVNKKCAEDYIEGERWYGSKACLLQKSIGLIYITYITNQCLPEYAERWAQERMADKLETKQCLLKTQLPLRYSVYLQGQCATGYKAGKKISDNVFGFLAVKECIKEI